MPDPLRKVDVQPVGDDVVVGIGAQGGTGDLNAA